MYKLVINFSDGSTMPIEWAKGAKKVSIKAAVRKLLAFRLAIRTHASRKSPALPLRKFTVDFYINGNKIQAGIQAVPFSPKSEIIEDSLNWLIDMTYDAIELDGLKANVGSPEKISELEPAQAN